MDISSLTSKEITELKVRHRAIRNGKERDRIKAVLLFAKGWSVSRIAEALLLDDSSIRRHINDYRSTEKLTIDSGGSTEKLSPSQTEELVSHLSEHLYHHNHQVVWV